MLTGDRVGVSGSGMFFFDDFLITCQASEFANTKGRIHQNHAREQFFVHGFKQAR